MVVLDGWCYEMFCGLESSTQSAARQGIVISLNLHCMPTERNLQAIITFAQESFSAHRSNPPTQAPPIGRGIGLAFALLFLQMFSSLCTHHFFYRGASTGVMLRGGLITAIYSRSLHLSSRARSTLSNGKLVNHISTGLYYSPYVWTSPNIYNTQMYPE